MDLKIYFESNNLKPTPWAIDHGISSSVINRCLNGGGISLKNAAKIEIETDGKVKAIDLLKNN